MRKIVAEGVFVPERSNGEEREYEQRCRCVFCGTSTAEVPVAESARVRSSVKEFGAETFTVWRCAKCGSLHAKEPIDYDRYYRDYWLNGMKCGFVSKVTSGKRMKILERVGLESGNTLLDYGCGSGHFVRYARERKVRAEGYDPYSEAFADASVLDRRYDFVTVQDVLEHVDDPRALVVDLKSYVVPGGCMAIGTPNADAIDLHNPLDQVGPLHQPYHRHIPSVAQLQRLASEGSWQVIEFRKHSNGDTRVPFINKAFVWRWCQSGGGFIDVASDPVDLRRILAHPYLIFWGFFGSFFSRKTDVEIVVRAPG
jgi:2-polyprenyl-3-methyl-5-hydroxy-6-metoxy-1,4-benzoquinol methylase